MTTLRALHPPPPPPTGLHSKVIERNPVMAMENTYMSWRCSEILENRLFFSYGGWGGSRGYARVIHTSALRSLWREQCLNFTRCPWWLKYGKNLKSAVLYKIVIIFLGRVVGILKILNFFACYRFISDFTLELLEFNEDLKPNTKGLELGWKVWWR